MRRIVSTLPSRRFKSNRLLPALHRRSRLRTQVTAAAASSSWSSLARIRIFVNSTVLPTPFLDIHELVSLLRRAGFTRTRLSPRLRQQRIFLCLLHGSCRQHYHRSLHGFRRRSKRCRSRFALPHLKSAASAVYQSQWWPDRLWSRRLPIRRFGRRRRRRRSAGERTKSPNLAGQNPPRGHQWRRFPGRSCSQLRGATGQSIHWQP